MIRDALYYEFREKCQEYGLAVTKQRHLVYRVLSQSKKHPTADQIYEKILEQFPKISRMSVYRILETFAACRMIRRVNHPGYATRYDMFYIPHHHLICTHCGMVQDIDPVPANFKVELRKVPEGFQIQDYCIDFQGLCADCAQSTQ